LPFLFLFFFTGSLYLLLLLLFSKHSTFSRQSHSAEGFKSAGIAVLYLNLKVSGASEVYVRVSILHLRKILLYGKYSAAGQPFCPIFRIYIWRKPL
jgi:hypothetical protein